MNPDKVQIIITGGTIDSYYDVTRDTAVPGEVSVLPEYFKSLKLDEDVRFETVCMKDSRDIERSDLENILEKVKSSDATYQVVTHGTYTMGDTGRYLEEYAKDLGKVIVLTGSMIPLNGFSMSDAGFNLGFVFGVMRSLDPGVYVAMNGNVFTPNEVSKFIKEGKFESLFNKKHNS